MGYSHFKRQGYTLIELIIVLVIVVIIAVAGISLFYFFIDVFFTVPEEINRDVIVNNILSKMVEGDNTAKGLRYTDTIDTIEDNRLVFTNDDGQIVEFKVLDNKLKRSIDGGAAENIPYYILDNITISGQDGVLFTYLDTDEATTAVANDVRRIIIRINATISGVTSTFATSIRVKMFED